jgi:hypothetical protein
MLTRLKTLITLVVFGLISVAAGGIPTLESNRDLSINEQNNEYSKFELLNRCTDNKWMVLAIIFIILFLLAFIACIFLFVLRIRTIKAIRQEQAMQNKPNPRNVWYGGNHI